MKLTETGSASGGAYEQELPGIIGGNYWRLVKRLIQKGSAGRKCLKERRNELI